MTFFEFLNAQSASILGGYALFIIIMTAILSDTIISLKRKR